MPEFVIAAGVGMLGYVIAIAYIGVYSRWCRKHEEVCGHYS